MSCAEPATKRRKGETMGEKGIDGEVKINMMSQEADIDMFSEDFPQLDSGASFGSTSGQATKQNSNLSFEESFNDSPDMFSDFSSEFEQSIVEEGQIESEEGAMSDGCQWRGVSLAELRGPTMFPQLPPVKPSKSHTVLCQVASGPTRPPSEAWDSQHVRMPFSSQSLYPVATDGGRTKLKCRWDLVKEALNRTITTSLQLEAAILSYNSKYSNRWDFQKLHLFFSDVLEPPEVRCFFNDLLPSIIRLALDLPVLINHPIPLLRQHSNHSISLSQLQIASLLANALLCTYPRRNTAKQGSEYATFPDINFNRLFSLHMKRPKQHGGEKLKCIFHYFRRVTHRAPEGVVTFSRHYIQPNHLPQWDRSTRNLTRLHVSSVGTIEDQGYGMLQMDFANKRIGGGVLGWGCVQEEIRFIICPELIISRLFTESLDATESLLIAGCERFSDYTGYADNFEWDGDHSDKTPRDSSGRLLCTVVAIDAMALRFPNIQFQPQNLRRELNKAYAGFQNSEIPADQLAPVATGNWGCGAFRGNARLKALLQMMAAAQAGRDLAYFTFGDKVLRDDIFDMYTFLRQKQVTVGQLWNIICLYNEQCYRKSKWTQELYSFVREMISPRAFNEQKGNSVRSPRKQRPSFKNSDEPVSIPSFLYEDTNLSEDSQKPGSTREPSGGVTKNNTQRALSIGKKDESGLQNDSNKEQTIVAKKNEGQVSNVKKDSDCRRKENSDFNASYVEKVTPDDAASSDAVAPSSHRASLLESLELYDNVSSSAPKRKISDYFNAINVPK